MAEESEALQDLFDDLGVSEVWELNGMDRTEVVYLVPPQELPALVLHDVETRLTERLGDVKVWVSEYKVGLSATLVYLKDK